MVDYGAQWVMADEPDDEPIETCAGCGCEVDPEKVDAKRYGRRMVYYCAECLEALREAAWEASHEDR